MLSSRYVRLLLGASAMALVVAIGCGSDERDAFENTPGASSSSGESSGFNPQDGGQGDSAFDPDAACATAKIEAKRAPANILFIVDRSGSMNCNPPPTTTSQACEQTPTTANTSLPTKWFTTKEALKKAIAKMPPEDSAGLTLFNVDNTCGVVATPNVAVKKVDDQQLIDLASLLDGVVPEGLTPIVGGVTLGYQHLHNNPFVGRKYIVLITDGQETCAEGMVDNFLSSTVPNALAVGIRTFAIGAPGSEPARSLLSRIAFAGGTASSATCKHTALPADVGDCHFDLTDPSLDLATALGQALDKVSRDALTCEYDVPSSATGTVDLGKVNVVYSPANGAPQTVPQDTSKECQLADGWQYSSDGKRIIMCGPACDKLRADTTGSVSIQLGCQTVVR